MKKFIISIIVTLILLMACTNPTNVSVSKSGTIASKSVDPYDSSPDIQYRYGNSDWVVVCGDSRAWGGGVYTQLPQSVVNIGIPGSTLRSTVNFIQSTYSLKPKYMFLFTGVNDELFMIYTEFQGWLYWLSNYCYNSNCHMYIMDQTINGSSTFIQQCFKALMCTVPNTTYLPVNYVSTDFIDNYHLNSNGYAKVQAVMLQAIGN